MTRPLFLIPAALFLSTVAASVQAQSLQFAGEAEIALAFPSGGGGSETLFEGALQFGHESGVYVGLGLEALNGAAPDRFDVSIALGYATEIAPGVEVGIEYARHYLNVSGYDTHELVLAAAFPLLDRWSGEVELAYDIPSSTVDISAAAEIAITDRFSAGLTLGHDGTVRYGDIGVGYALNDMAALIGRLEWEEGAGTTVVLGFAFAFGG